MERGPSTIFLVIRKMTAIRQVSISNRSINRTVPANFPFSQWTVIQFRLRNFARSRVAERSTTQRVSRSFPAVFSISLHGVQIVTRSPPTREIGEERFFSSKGLMPITAIAIFRDSHGPVRRIRCACKLIVAVHTATESDLLVKYRGLPEKDSVWKVR